MVTLAFVISVSFLWLVVPCSLASIPYLVGYLVHVSRGDDQLADRNKSRAFYWAACTAGAVVLTVGSAALFEPLARNYRESPLDYVLFATLGQFLEFLHIALASWYGPLAVAASVLGGFLLHRLIHAILPFEAGRNAVAMAVAGGVAMASCYLLTLWLENGGTLSFTEPPSNGVYIPPSGLAWVTAPGVVAGAIASHFTDSSNAGMFRLAHIVGTLLGVSWGCLFGIAMWWHLPAESSLVVNAVLATAAAAPTLIAVALNLYVRFFSALHRAGYPGTPLSAVSRRRPG